MSFTPTTPHFFQPLLPGFHHHLSIPLAFFKCHLEGQISRESSSALLRSYGRTWSVKIKDRRFEDGWEEFAADHDLHVGDFLVFGYGGNMTFDVLVLDTSACRRECPQFATKQKESAEKIGQKRPILDTCATPSSEKRVKRTDAADDAAALDSGALGNEESSSKSTGGSTLFDWAVKNWPMVEREGFRKMPPTQVLQSSVSLLMQAISMQLGARDASSDVWTLEKEKELLELKLQILEGDFKAMKEKLETVQKQRDVEVATQNEELKKVRNQLDEEKVKRAELEQGLEN